MRRWSDRSRIGNWGKRRPPNAENCCFPSGRGVACGCTVNDNGCRTSKARVARDAGEERLGMMDGKMNLDRFHAYGKGEISDEDK